MSDRPRGGRRPEDYPDVQARDNRIVYLIRKYGRPGISRNELADLAGETRLKVRYSLNRLRRRGLVEHVSKGNEGHGYWAVKETETET